MMVGASVDPYVFFTCAPNASDAIWTNVSEMPAPPLEINRILATRSGVNVSDCIIETKKVGGPTMNVTWCSSMRSIAIAGFQRAIYTVGNGVTPGSVMPFSRPEMCAHGAGISTQSPAEQSCSLRICTALY